MSDRGRVGRIARALGFAGLLPQAAAVATMVAAAFEPSDFTQVVGFITAVALIYPIVILSFLGGTWWGLAMRAGARQGAVVALAVVPSLAAMAAFVILVAVRNPGWVFVALGSAIVLTLLVDRRLADSGLAPEGWMRLRVPLSIGLGGLTIVAGVVIGGLPGA